MYQDHLKEIPPENTSKVDNTYHWLPLNPCIQLQSITRFCPLYLPDLSWGSVHCFPSPNYISNLNPTSQLGHDSRLQAGFPASPLALLWSSVYPQAGRGTLLYSLLLESNPSSYLCPQSSTLTISTFPVLSHAFSPLPTMLLPYRPSLCSNPSSLFLLRTFEVASPSTSNALLPDTLMP